MTNTPLDERPPLDVLLDIEGFRELCRSFSELYGIGVKVFAASGAKLADVRALNAEHCGYLFSVHSTRTQCTRLVEHIKTVPLTEADKVTTVRCFSGLRYKLVPLVHQGDNLGRLIIGPYAPDSLAEPPAELKQYEPDLSLVSLGQYLQKIPRAPDTSVEQVVAHMVGVFRVVLEASYKSWITSKMHVASVTAAFDDLKKANEALRFSNEQLKDLDRLKSNFVATVSHELRTPLTSVIGYAEMLLEGMAGELEAEQRDYVKTILEKGESLLSLIVQVLDLSRIESGNARMVRRQVHPQEVVDLAVSDVAPQAQQRRIELDVSVDPAVEPIALDADKIRRVLTNLIANAIKFTSAGGTVTVRVDLCDAPPAGADAFDRFEPARNRHLRMVVSDTGIGIPEDKLDRIFDAFFQVDNSSTREFGGTGLGLAIARNFVRAHSGTISVESRVGAGSKFTVLLPYVIESATQAVGVDGVAQASPMALA